jgi:dephospho-CoA kinase
MIKVGLTGGYATGKSFVAGELERLGCHIIHADLLGHEVLQPTGEAYKPTVEAFGSGILDPDGVIDRKKLAGIVFANPELLKKLNGFVHPAVIRREEELIQDYAKANPNGITVIEAAILIETGRHAAFDRLILTVCDEETQIARGMKRDHLTREQVSARIGAQLPADEKKRYADYVVDTSGAKQETVRQVEKIARELREAAKSHI